MFGYRGQWRLEIERHRGERAGHDAVYTSVTPEDFAKVATRAGCHATVTNSDDTPVVALRHRRRAFLAFMDWRVPQQNLYSQVALQADVTLRHRPRRRRSRRSIRRFKFVKVWRTDGAHGPHAACRSCSMAA